MAISKNIELAVADLEKQFGKNTIMQLGNRSALKIDVIPTGILSIDDALGVMGFPRGRIIEVYGPESSGKTTLALQVIAQAQASGGNAAFVDAEHALDPKYAAALGLNVKELWISQPDCGEQALEIVERLVKTGEFDIIVVDSVAALVPRAELDGEMGDAQMGLQARLMSQAMRKLTMIVGKTKTCLVFINQVREKIGVMFGNPETTTGGRALKFYSSMRIEIRRIGLVKDGDVVTGIQTKVKVVKNKVASPFRECEPEIVFGQGFSQYADLITLGTNLNVLEKSGSWFAYKSERIGQGRANAIAFLTEHTETAQALFNEVRARLVPEDKA
jgi:recombination protein RecA